MPRFVEFSFGSLGEVLSETPRTRLRPAGVNVLPLNTGGGDGFGGATQWYPLSHVQDADMDAWHYDPARNLYSRIRSLRAA